MVFKEIEVFYDGACPLRMREIAALRKLDKDRRIEFSDIASPAFDPASLGRTQRELMGTIHGRLSDGTIIEGVEVFRRLYAAVGFGRLVSWTRAPIVSQALDAAYSVFAKNRLRLTGRCEDGACPVKSS